MILDRQPNIADPQLAVLRLAPKQRLVCADRARAERRAQNEMVERVDHYPIRLRLAL